ncbi:TB2/DP1, HVA22 family-domain-containing protein [Mrakia frigida]|uniref:HVA22/TB2/DP1 family protein n=1 Tax=Mrakia frigida TaxID=29902 RepID=UPI003FCBF045
MSAQQKAQGLLSHPLVQQARSTANVQLAGLDKELSKYKFANDLESKTQVPKAVAFLGLVALFVTLIFFNLFGLASPISNLAGFALPAYLSIQALESSGTSDDKQWLTYWIVFSSLTTIESLFLRLVVYYMPFYFVFKTVFIVWLQLPATRGAEVLYIRVLHPLLVSRSRSSATSGFQVPPTADLHEKTL